MSDFTDYTESNIVNWVVGGQSMPSPIDPIYVALHTSDPTDSGQNNEVSASSYSRPSTQAGTDWDTSNNTFTNIVDIEFPEAQEDWGNISHFSLWDSSTGGNAIAYSELAQARDILSGDAPVFRDGSLNGSVN
jgi:hypothetical protein